MLGVYDRLSEFGIVPLVVFTGGEPMLFAKDVLAVIEHVSQFGSATRVVTNASWAATPRAADRMIKRLKNAGLTEINYSVDDFHQAHIPLKTVRNAVLAALEHGIPVLLAHKTYPGSQSSLETYEQLLGCGIPVFDPDDRDVEKLRPICFSSGYTVPVGRGSEDVDLDEWMSQGIDDGRWRGPCEEVLANVQITPGGRLSPCCGLVDRALGVFYIGSVLEHDIFELLRKANNCVLYNWLALAGPSGIMDHVIAQDPSIEFAGRYVQNCQLCQELFSDERKKALVAQSLESMAQVLSVSRCVFEAQRSAYWESVSAKMESRADDNVARP